MGRPPCCESDGLKRGSWDVEEDQILVSHIHMYGHSNWKILPKLAGLQRCGKSCRLRWLNYLRPDIKRGNFTREEEDAIIHLHQILGNRWSVIAARLPGRTDNEIKNVWHTHLKKRLATNSSSASHSNRSRKRGGGGGSNSSNYVTLATTSSTVLSSSYDSSSASTLPSPSSVTAASPGHGEISGFDGNAIAVDEYFLDDPVLPWLEEGESGSGSSENMQQNNREEHADDFWLRLLMEVEASPESHRQFPIDHLFFA